MDKLPTSFGLSIAFLFPGFIALVAIAQFAPTVRSWLSGEDTGGAILATVASAGLGAFISHCRSLLFDEALKRWRPHLDELNHENRGRDGKEFAYQTLITNHYHFYMFALNTVVAGWSLFFAWWWVVQPPWRLYLATLGVAIGASLVLVRTGNGALEKFNSKAVQLLGRRPEGTGNEQRRTETTAGA